MRLDPEVLNAAGEGILFEKVGKGDRVLVRVAVETHLAGRVSPTKPKVKLHLVIKAVTVLSHTEEKSPVNEEKDEFKLVGLVEEEIDLA